MPINSPKDIARFVRQRRKELGWSQETLASQLAVSRQWINALEGGKATVQMDLLLRALKLLNITITFSPGRAPAESDVKKKAITRAPIANFPALDLAKVIASHKGPMGGAK